MLLSECRNGHRFDAHKQVACPRCGGAPWYQVGNAKVMAIATTCAGCQHPIMYDAPLAAYRCACGVTLSDEALCNNGVPFNWLPTQPAATAPAVTARTLASSYPPAYVCTNCNRGVVITKLPTGNLFTCDCWTAVEGGRKPAHWTQVQGAGWVSSTPPPRDQSKCATCGKDLETVGLNRTYPPKRDDMGRAICPHCGYVQPGGSASGFATMMQTQGGFDEDQAGS